MKYTDTERDAAKAELLRYLTPVNTPVDGKTATVYTIRRGGGLYCYTPVVADLSDRIFPLIYPSHKIAVLLGHSLATVDGFNCIRARGVSPSTMVGNLAMELFGDPSALRHQSI